MYLIQVPGDIKMFIANNESEYVRSALVFSLWLLILYASWNVWKVQLTLELSISSTTW